MPPSAMPPSKTAPAPKMTSKTSPKTPSPPLSFQGLIARLQQFWDRQGCVIIPPYDMCMGAGTFHPATSLRVLGPQPWRAAYLQPCRRPADGRYGENPNRLQHYFQYQVVIKPSPDDAQDLYLQSLAAIGIDPAAHDIRFIEDDWESPTLGAAGLGWEIWCDGMEVTQFTYMQQMGGIELDPITVELTYGIERLAMYIQNVDNVFDLRWNTARAGHGPILYRDIFHQAEKRFSHYNFSRADIAMLESEFAATEHDCHRCLDRHGEGGPLVEPAWDQVLRASHIFNLLDARGAIGAADRQSRIGLIRSLAKKCALQCLKDAHD